MAFVEGKIAVRAEVYVRVSNSSKNGPSNLSDRLTEMEEGTSTLQQKAVSGQKNTENVRTKVELNVFNLSLCE